MLGIALQGQDIAFMVALAFAIAASAIFPALLMSIYWRGYTTAGAVSSIVGGAVSALALISISPTIMVDILGYDEAERQLHLGAIGEHPARRSGVTPARAR